MGCRGLSRTAGLTCSKSCLRPSFLALISAAFVLLQDLLEACGRAHNLEEVYRAIDAVHQSGVPSWSLDLMSGLPQLTMDTWRQSLTEVVAARPNHISVYDLQVSLAVGLHELGGIYIPSADALGVSLVVVPCNGGFYPKGFLTQILVISSAVRQA